MKWIFALGFGLVAVVVCAQDLPTRLQQETWADYYANLHALPRPFVRSVMDVESNWQARAFPFANGGDAVLVRLLESLGDLAALPTSNVPEFTLAEHAVEKAGACKDRGVAWVQRRQGAPPYLRLRCK